MLKLSFIMLVMITITFTDESATSEQVAKDLDFILRHRTENQVPADGDARFTVDNVSELKTFATGLVRLYQAVISSQDIPACNFTPSCSRFAMEAIQKGGLLKGALLGADRLMRCHWFSRKLYNEKYGIAQGSGKRYDPVERYLRSEENE
jgi:putative membrane protein insertion efficiency factor